MPGLPYQAHSMTSKVASVDAGRFAGTKRHQVLRYIEVNPGVSDLDIQAGLRMNPSTQRPRRVELENAGLIQWTGIRAGANLYTATGKEYPTEAPASFWGKRRGTRPSAAELAATVAYLRSCYHLLPAMPPEVLKVLRWLAKRAG